MPYFLAWSLAVIFPLLIVKGFVSEDFIVFMYVNRFQKLHRKNIVNASKYSTFFLCYILF